jgi:hypothetical protein
VLCVEAAGCAYPSGMKLPGVIVDVPNSEISFCETFHTNISDPIDSEKFPEFSTSLANISELSNFSPCGVRCLENFVNTFRGRFWEWRMSFHFY